MKNLLTTFLAVCSIGTALPAIAGPDWQVIDHARVAKAGHLQQEAQEQPQPASAACIAASKKIVLPLDHGPRAQTTPWLNQQRLHKAEEDRSKACATTEHGNSRHA